MMPPSHPNILWYLICECPFLRSKHPKLRHVLAFCRSGRNFPKLMGSNLEKFRIRSYGALISLKTWDFSWIFWIAYDIIWYHMISFRTNVGWNDHFRPLVTFCLWRGGGCWGPGTRMMWSRTSSALDTHDVKHVKTKESQRCITKICQICILY